MRDVIVDKAEKIGLFRSNNQLNKSYLKPPRAPLQATLDTKRNLILRYTQESFDGGS